MNIRLTLAILLCSSLTFAQNRQCNQEISVGIGAFPAEQLFDGTFIGILEPTMYQYSNTMNSGIYFVNYKYYVSKKVAIGFTAGMEQESGGWNYVDMQGKPDDWNSYRIGTFSRTAYTVAPELSAAYINRKHVRLYTSAGLGATFIREKDNYDTTQYGKSYLGGSLVQNRNVIRLTAYYSPFGINVKAGGHLDFYTEVGIGYKGMLNFGLTYRLNTIAACFRGIPVPSPDAVILLPADYPNDSDLRFLEDASVHKKTHQRIADYSTQINTIASGVSAEGGNVFKVTRIRGSDMNVSSLKGEVYYAKNYDSFKTAADQWKMKAFSAEQCAYIVIYTSGSRYGRALMELNDSEIKMHPYTKRVVKVTKEGLYKIATTRNTISLDVKFGNYYYLKAFRTRSWSTASLVDNARGELESSLIDAKNEKKSNTTYPGRDEGY